jgi:hypothetical protein
LQGKNQFTEEKKLEEIKIFFIDRETKTEKNIHKK